MNCVWCDIKIIDENKSKNWCDPCCVKCEVSHINNRLMDTEKKLMEIEKNLIYRNQLQ